MNTVPVSAVVVSRNEGKLLSECLQSIQFCDEVIVYNMESTDNTVAIANQYNATVIPHKVVPVVEEVRVEAVQLCKYQWIMFIDPDERIAPSLAHALSEFIRNPVKTVGIVTAPWVFYFKDKRLKGTMWGTNKVRPILFNKTGVVLTPDVHVGTKLKPGFRELALGNTESANITHLWSDSFNTLVSKHRRYIKKEGIAKYNNGERYAGLYRHLRATIMAFYSCFFFYRGYRDGFNGLILSLFWSWYTFASLNSLRRYEKTIAR